MKTKLKKKIRSWRKKGGERNGYIVLKKEYRRLCEEKKKKERESWEREIEEMKTEGQMWKVINRERKRRNGVKEEIKMEEWEGH